MKKDYVITCSVEEDEDGELRIGPHRVAARFEPDYMTQAFRLVDADGNPLYYGLTYSHALSHQAQDDYEPYCGCVATEYFLNGEWEEI